MGKLRDSDMDQLEKWIGTGPKTFTLLYSITQHGCNPQIFHSRCDNQGPTVTVLYNQQVSVYGAYASISWQSCNSRKCDNSAFMFKLHFNGNTDAVKFPRTGNGNEIYDYASCGPIFGLNYDLYTFNTIVNNSGGYFQLTGNMNTFGHAFSNQGLNVNQINNGNMIVTELEVYKVSDGQRKSQVKRAEPWRMQPEWNSEFLSVLMSDIIGYKGSPNADIPEANVLVIGPVGAGKSSFFNTINSIFRERITQRARCGSAEQSLTTAYKQYRIRTKSDKSLNVRLCDTRGLEEYQDLDILELNYLLEGHVPDHYEFNPATPINPDTLGFVKFPKASDKIHCVALVVDASTMDVMSAKVLQKLKNFRALINKRGIPQVVLLTKVDKLSTGVDSDISTVFSDEKVGDAVERASEMFGLPRINIQPVKNYEKEPRLNDNISILALLALQQILNFTEDYMEDLIDKIENNASFD